MISSTALVTMSNARFMIMPRIRSGPMVEGHDGQDRRRPRSAPPLNRPPNACIDTRTILPSSSHTRVAGSTSNPVRGRQADGDLVDDMSTEHRLDVVDGAQDLPADFTAPLARSGQVTHDLKPELGLRAPLGRRMPVPPGRHR